MDKNVYAMFRAGDTRPNKDEIILIPQDNPHDARKVEKSMYYDGYQFVGTIISVLDDLQIRTGIGYKVEQENYRLREVQAVIQPELNKA